MIIYGSKMYGVKNVVYSHGVCAHCGYYTKQKSYDGRKWGHLYFIPLIPEGGHVRVLRECSRCGMGQHLPLPQVEEVYREVEELIEPCVIAAGQGEHTFQRPGEAEPIDTGAFLAEAMDMLYVTGHADDIPGILALLENDGSVYEQAVAESAYLELKGNPDGAMSRLQDAADARPDAVYPPFLLATFAARAGQPEQQLNYLETASELAGGDDVSILLEMAGPLEALKRFDELTEVLDRCIALVPELGHDKKFMKLHKKYAKKAAKQARV